MKEKLSHSEAGKLGAIASAEAKRKNKVLRIEEYNQNPKLCGFCKISLSYDKVNNNFCSRSCGAKFHNAIRGYTSAKVLEQCLFCSKPITEKGQHKYCSHQCQQNYRWQIKKEQILADGVDHSSNNRAGKKYLVELHNGKCQICGLVEWNGQPMPLVLDHINGNPYDNSLGNLRVICHNCNAQTPTFTGKNKGNGRVARAKRYKVEKDIFQQMKDNVA